MIRLRALALLLAAALPLADAGASTVLRPLLSSRDTYGESFTFIADLEVGTYLHVSLALTNFGPGPLKGICRALVIPPQGKPWNASTRVGKDGWSWSDGREERLAVGPCSASIDEASTEVLVPLDGGTVRLAFAGRPVRRSLLHDAVVVVAGDLYRSEIMLYRTPTTATLSVPGQPPRTVSGAGYADHSRSMIPPKHLAQRWVRFRALRGDRALILLGREGRDGKFTPLWACEDRDRCRDFEAFHVERDGARREPAFRVEVTDGRADPVEIRSGALLYRDAPVEDLGILGKLVAPFVGNPVTYLYRGTAVLRPGGAVDGILEVEQHE